MARRHLIVVERVADLCIGPRYLFRKYSPDKWMSDRDGVPGVAVAPPVITTGVQISGKIIFSMIDE